MKSLDEITGMVVDAAIPRFARTLNSMVPAAITAIATVALALGREGYLVPVALF